MQQIAVFVSPHGFGHAARACAVIEALAGRWPGLKFHVFTTVPRWFFSQSLSAVFEHHPVDTDVGLVQISPLTEDAEATADALGRAPWRDPVAVDEMSKRIGELGCGLVIADISVFGLRAARRAGLPSVLVENFTWDWIYENLETTTDLRRFGDEMAEDYAAVDLRIQTLPVCRRVPGSVLVGPVARSPRAARWQVRQQLGIPQDQAMVLASMGGVGWDYGSLKDLHHSHSPWIVVPGGSAAAEVRGRLLLLPFHSNYYHPDLVRAADVVVGKLGYSTVAETVDSGAAFAYVERPQFPESPVLAEYVEEQLVARPLDRRRFEDSRWLPTIELLLAVERRGPGAAQGADEVARAIGRRFPAIFD